MPDIGFAATDYSDVFIINHLRCRVEENPRLSSEHDAVVERRQTRSGL